MRRTDRVVVLALLLAGFACAACAGGLNLDKVRKVDAYNYAAPTDRCAPGSTDKACALTGHYLLIHKDGYALTPDGKAAVPDDKGKLPQAFDNQLDRIVKGIERQAANLAKSGCGDTVKILLFVHGGLNGFGTSIDRMVQWASEKESEKGSGKGSEKGLLANSCYYPIFINWDSAIASSLFDDIVGLRFGQRSRRWYEHVYAWLTAPVVLTSRMVSAMGSLPIAIGHSVYNFGGGVAAAWKEEPSDAERAWTALDVGLYQVLLPFQIVTTPLVEGFGTPAWQIMKRRANLAVAVRLPRDVGIFESLAEVARREPRDQRPRGGGAAWYLLVKLREAIAKLQEAHRADSSKPAVSVTLVGHSMGAMLLDRLVAISGDDLPIANVIYLAPAASNDDVIHTVLVSLHRQEVRRCAALQHEERLKASEPVLTRVKDDPSRTPEERRQAMIALDKLAATRQELSDHGDTKLWIFTLNARDEAREISHPYEWFLWTAPRGSLLQWIDGYFEPNNTRGEAVAGKHLNLAAFQERREKAPGCLDGRLVDNFPVMQPTPPGSTTGIDDFVNLPMAIPGIRDGRVWIFVAKRKTDTLLTKFTNVPSEHGDFTKPRFVAQVLCRVDDRAFRGNFCREKVRDLPPQPVYPPPDAQLSGVR